MANVAIHTRSLLGYPTVAYTFVMKFQHDQWYCQVNFGKHQTRVLVATGIVPEQVFQDALKEIRNAWRYGKYFSSER